MAEASHFIQWIGGAFYSKESWVKEAKKMGASRRINFVPNNVVKGVSRMYLVSDMPAEADRQKYQDELHRRAREVWHWNKEHPDEIRTPSVKNFGKLPRSPPAVFGYFTINAIVYITVPGEDVSERLKQLGVTKYEYQEGAFGFQDERGCGSLQIGGTYFLSEEDMEKVKTLAQSSVLESTNIHIFKTPIPLPEFKRFRGVKMVAPDLRDKIEAEATE